MDTGGRMSIETAGSKILFTEFNSNRREINKRQAVLAQARGNCGELCAQRRQQDDCVRETVLFGEFCELLQVLVRVGDVARRQYRLGLVILIDQRVDDVSYEINQVRLSHCESQFRIFRDEGRQLAVSKVAKLVHRRSS